MVANETGHLYVLGGFNKDLMEDDDLLFDEDWLRTRPIFSELWTFNIYTNEWEKMKKTYGFPKQMASHCVELLSDEFLSNNNFICNYHMIV